MSRGKGPTKMNKVLNQQEIEAIRERDKARTPGKWDAIGPNCVGIVAQGRAEDEESYDVIPARGVNDEDTPENHEVDYAFIAACSEDIPNLLATVEALRNLLTEARDDYGQHSPGCSGGITETSRGEYRFECDCGYREWLVKVREVLGDA